MTRNPDDDRLMHSVVENDKQTIDEGKLLADSISQGLGSFTPDLIFEKLVKDYKEAKRIYGDVILRELTGYDPSFIEKNLPLPEFKKILKDVGLDDKRVRLDWVSAAEGEKFQQVITDFVNEVKALGPNPLRGVRM